MNEYKSTANEVAYSKGEFQFNENGVCLNPKYIFDYEVPKKVKLQVFYCFDGKYYNIGWRYSIGFGSHHGCGGAVWDMTHKEESFTLDWQKLWLEASKDYESSLKYTIDNIIKTIERDKRENQSQWQSNYFEPFFDEFCKPKQLALF
jgi:hypothetical protein